MDILIADDSAVSRRLLEVELNKWGFRVTIATSGAEAWEILQRPDAPRLVILDWMMPGLSGPEVCRKVRGQGRPQYTYILLLTSRNEKEDLIEGMESGADDYVIKPFDRNELKVRLGPGLRIIELQQALWTAQEALRDQATRDSLTRLWNRHSILEMLDRELARCHRQGQPLGMALGDLDQFKLVNDTHGHLAGDRVLVEVASRMQHSLRPYDAVGRYGGEEFLVILPGCGEEQTLQAAERIREQIAERPVEGPGIRLNITVSFGATFLEPSLQSGPEAMIRAADAALYEAKRSGRNRSLFQAMH